MTYLSPGALKGSALVLFFVYVVLVLPFAYRAIDAGLSAIDVATLAEAARSLGAGWPTVMFRVIAPNIRSALLNASLLSVALTLGEFTVASLLNYVNLQVAVNQLAQANAGVSVAVVAALLLFTFLLLLVLSLVGGGAGAAARASRGREGPRERRGDQARQSGGRRRGPASRCGSRACAASTAPSPRSTGSTSRCTPASSSPCSGPSGCGKTTALRLVAGLEDADGGRV